MNEQKLKGDFFHTDFWKINAGHIFAVVVFLLGLFYSSGRLSEKIDAFAGWKEATDTRIQDMAANGVQRQQALALIQQLANTHEQRLQRIEDVAVKLSVLSEKIDQLGSDLKEIKENKKQ